MKEILQDALASDNAAQKLVAMSSELATGNFWLEQSVTRSLTVAKQAPPAGEWGKKVDAIEAPFAPKYDEEEYQNPGLQMLNLAELTMIADAFGVRPPWLAGFSGRELQGRQLLEIGCGTGRIALFGAGLGGKVTAVDQTAGYVEVVAKKASRLPATSPDPRLIVAPAEALQRDDLGEFAYVTAMFGVLNHCENWRDIIKNITNLLSDNGTLILSMYGSPEAAVYQEIARGLSYAPAILTRRAPGGLLLGEDATEILPASFPYPNEVLAELKTNDLNIQTVQPFLSVTSLYPRQLNNETIAAYIEVVGRRYGPQVGAFLEQYQDSPAQLLAASLCVDYYLAPERINEAAYFGVIAKKEGRS